MNILVLGASGMLGSAVFRYFSQYNGFNVIGSVRNDIYSKKLKENKFSEVIQGIDIKNHDDLVSLFAKTKPNIVINCIGLVKQLKISNDPLSSLQINAILPHQLANICDLVGARLIHLSTDCVFSGLKGMYTEDDIPDATDLYGRSKLLGEVCYPNSITLRTSIIGHELNGSRSLINWFLSQEGAVRGFKKAVFSGLPTVEIAQIIRDYVIPNPCLHGLYHLSSEPINKYELLSLVAEVYAKNIEIIPDESLVIDRSLDSSRFRNVTGFQPKPWSEMIMAMHEFS